QYSPLPPSTTPLPYTTLFRSQASSTGQLETIAKSVAQRLDSVTPALQDAIRNSAQITGQMTSDAQTKMAGELKNTRDQISQIQRSEEHTSELQSRGHVVCRLL